MLARSQTWNGAESISTPDVTCERSGRIGLFFKGVRGLSEDRLHKYLDKALEESVKDAFLLTFQLRDCRGGKGERTLGRQAFAYLATHSPANFLKVLDLIPKYGRWDDILQFARYGQKMIRCSTLEIIREQLVKDVEAMSKGESISICAKWLPTENGATDKGLVADLCKHLNISPKKYRTEFISPLRAYMNIVEQYMCDKKWDHIDFSRVPSCAMKRLKKAFQKHTPANFMTWRICLNARETEVKVKHLQPHELIKEVEMGTADDVTQAQWNVLENEVHKLGTLQDAIVVVDVSRSMMRSYLQSTVAPIEVAIGMGLLISGTVDGPFKNHVITFSESPEFVKLTKTTLKDRFDEISKIGWGTSTNVQATFDLILAQATRYNLKEEDMPKRLIMISDMDFYHCGTDTNFELAEKKYRVAGYKLPQIIFWNVDGQSRDFPCTCDTQGTALISGFSPSIMKAILTGKEFTPWTIFRDTVDDERYDSVREAL
jgi:hypothetical protein